MQPTAFGTNLQLRALFATYLNSPPTRWRALGLFPSNVPIEILRNALIYFVHYGAMPHIAHCTGIKNSHPNQQSPHSHACHLLGSRSARSKKRSAPNPGLVSLPAWRLCLGTFVFVRGTGSHKRSGHLLNNVTDQTNGFNPPPPDLVGDIPLPWWALGH